MKKITPHLWFDKEAIDAAKLYTSLFDNSKINNITTLHDVPSPTGDCDVVSFELLEQPFMAISAGPIFKLNPSISFMINFDPSNDNNALKNLNSLWEKLAQGGKPLMEIGKYPFSDRYGWIQDKYGVSWQLILSKPEGEKRPAIVPSLMFVGQVAGRAEEAINFYLSVFKNSKQGIVARYGKNHKPDKENSIMFSDFMLAGQWFAAMDSARKHDFALNEAISLVIPCESQDEIDYYWEKMSADPKSEQCGWLKDKFGVSWQVWPTVLGDMLSKGSPEQKARVTQTFLKMKKFDIEALKRAHEKP